MGRPGELAGSCLQHYPPVYNNALRASVQGWMDCGCRSPTHVSCHSTESVLRGRRRWKDCCRLQKEGGKKHRHLFKRLSMIIYFYILNIYRILHKA